jgi:transposase
MMLVPAMRCWPGWWPRSARSWLSRRLRWPRAVEQLAQARERIAELEARLAQTPRNSSRPPPSQGLDKPPPRPRSLRKRSGRKPGDQDGHNGTTLAQAARPDREIRHEPGCCGRCGAGLAGRPVTGVERRQFSGLPQVTVTVTEHQLIERECGRGHRTKGAAPPGAEAPVQYGPRIAAIIVYMYTGQFLSKQQDPACGQSNGPPASALLPSVTLTALGAPAPGEPDSRDSGHLRESA